MDNAINVVSMKVARGKRKGITGESSSCHHHGN